MPYEGSRKHLLSYLDRPDAMAILARAGSRCGVAIRDLRHCQPRGSREAKESELPTFLARHAAGQYPGAEGLARWWAPHGGRCPTWDWLSLGSVADHPGVVLIEAKAHESELELKGKDLDDPSNLNKVENHDSIERCIEWANGWFRARGHATQLSQDRCYQVSNRLTWAAKLASVGAQVALVFVGFWGDNYFGDDFRDGEHARSVLRSHLDLVHVGETVNKVLTDPSGGSLRVSLCALPAEPLPG